MLAAPHAVSFLITNPDRDARAILAALRAYWQWTGYLPRLGRYPGGGIWLNAPNDVALEWMVAFGLPAAPDRQ